MNVSEKMEREKKSFLRTKTNKNVLIFAALLAAVYFYLILFAFEAGNLVLFWLLIAGEIFHAFQVFMYLYTAWETNYAHKKDENHTPSVDVFITVAGEPKDIVAETIQAVKRMAYPDFKVYILNDGFVAKRENWKEMEDLAKEEGVICITRQKSGGAKAGNINNGVRESSGELIVIFDADHIPHPDFLQKTVPYFIDPKVGFVQSPQFYKNYRLNYITRSSWEQQELFFGPICKGKNRMNAATMCGTNMVISRKALLQAGGMAEDSIAEDFLTGLRIHDNGWKSVYVGEVLAEGLAPEDFLSYFKQQFRWARGALDIIVMPKLFFSRKLTFKQKIQYFSSVSFYLSGAVVLMNALIPVAYFYTGAVPFVVSTMTLAAVFIPYIFVTLYVLQKSSNFTFTFRALIFSMASWNIHLKAMWAAVSRHKSTFEVTSKRQIEGNFINLVWPQIAYIALVVVGVAVAFVRESFSASFVANVAWAIINIAVFIPFIKAALPAPAPENGKIIGGDEAHKAIAQGQL